MQNLGENTRFLADVALATDNQSRFHCAMMRATGQDLGYMVATQVKYGFSRPKVKAIALGWDDAVFLHRRREIDMTKDEAEGYNLGVRAAKLCGFYQED